MYAANNKKIVFVNPPLSIARRYGSLGYAGGNEPPVGLCYLAGVVRKNGFDTAIIDAQAAGLNLNKTISLIMSYRPAYVGITAATMAIKSAYELAFGIKELDPAIKIIIGGCHVSSLPKETLEGCRSFDAGVIGEGEDTIVELMQALDKDEDLSAVKGIVSRQDKDILLSPPRNRIKDLDSLPYPAFDLLPDIKKRYRLPAQSLAGGHGFSLISSRGCFGKCLFCDKKVFGGLVTMHSAEYITEMACILNKDYGITDIMFEDDNFMISKERLESISSLFKKRQLKVKWSALARIDSVDGEALRIAKAGGCWQISYGIESGCQRILDFYEKGITISQIKNAMDITKKAGLRIKCFFMWGNPSEDKNSLRDTSEFIKGLGIDDISVTFFTPYHGSRIWKDIGSYGRLDNDTEKMSCFELVFRPFGLTDDYLISTRKKTLRDFYLRPRIFLSYLRRIKSMRMFRQLLLSAWCLFRYALKENEKIARFLIVNADDFGLTKGINSGIIKAFREGIVTSASLLSVGRYFDNAAGLAKENPGLDIGIHLCLTEERPVLGKEDIPSLLGEDGCFLKPRWDFIFCYVLGKIEYAEVEKELDAQIRKILDKGLKITHIDSHGYIHMLPGVLAVVIRLAKRYNIKIIRYPREKISFYDFKRHRYIQFCVLGLLCLLAKLNPGYKSFIKTDYFFGFMDSGKLNAGAIKKTLTVFKRGLAELICHPGEHDEESGIYKHWNYDWQGELKALISDCVKKDIKESEIELAGFKSII